MSHGTPINFGLIPSNVGMYRASDLETIFDNYDGQLTNKADLVGGLVPAAQLPSYVDDVLEYANLAAFPGTGESSKIYLADDTNLVYRWGGSSYVNIATGLALGTTSSTAYRGDRGMTAFNHSQETGNPHQTALTDLPDVQTALDGKYATPAGTAAQYVRGDGTLATSPTPITRSFTNGVSRSLVTGTGAVGFQVSSTRDAAVNYNVSSSTTATIGGASSITVVLEIAATNSATAGDWVEISRVANGQTITLAIVLQSVQTAAGNLGGIIPAGYYAKLRTITSGTASGTYNSGQEVLL